MTPAVGNGYAPGQGRVGPGRPVPVRPGVPNGGAGRNPNGKPQKPKFNPYKILQGLETNKLLSPRQLQAAANALSVLETRPEIHGYKEIATQLGKEKAAQEKGLMALGNRTTGQASSVYRGIAEQAAQGLANQQQLAQRLNQQSSEIAAQGAKGLEATQQGAVGALNANIEARGGSGGGSAQEALANAVAAQKAQQSQESQASQQFAASQGASTQGLLAGMAQASQMRGGETIGQMGRDIASRTAESDMKYNQNIQTALGKLGEAKASRGPKAVKDLLELRANEQKYQLGKQAVASEKQKLALEQQENSEAKTQQQFENALSLKKLGLEQWEAHHPHATNSEIRHKREDLRQEKHEVKALIPSLVSAYGPPTNQKQLNQFILALNGKASADPRIVRKIATHWFQKKMKKVAKDPNGASLGR